MAETFVKIKVDQKSCVRSGRLDKQSHTVAPLSNKSQILGNY